MWRRTGQTMLCGGRRRRHGCSKPTGHWTSMVSKLMPGCFSHHSTSCCASSCPTWNTWRSRSTSRTASSRLCQTSAKLSVSGMIDSCIQQQVEQCYVFIRKWNKMIKGSWGVKGWQNVLNNNVESWCILSAAATLPNDCFWKTSVNLVDHVLPLTLFET